MLHEVDDDVVVIVDAVGMMELVEKKFPSSSAHGFAISV